MPQRHDAFISYSHAHDALLAASLEKGLERLAKPIFKLRAIDVFRDKTSLAAAPGLWSGIQDHLTASKWFLLLASPASAASSWCSKETAWWLEHQGAATVLIVLTQGEIVWDARAGDFDWSRTTALSATLRGRFNEEPLYVDLRWALQETRSISSDARFRDAILDLAAPIRGLPKDQLDGEDVRQLRRTKRLAQAGVTTIAIVAAVAIWQAIEATRQRHVAEQQRDTALSRQLAAQASELRVQQPRLSLLLAAQALAVRRTAEASTALLRALNAAPFARMVERPETFWSLAVSDDEQWAVIGDGEGGVERVRLATGEVVRLVRDDAPSRSQGALGKPTLAVAVTRDGSSIASGGFDQAITLWNHDRAIHTIAGRHEGFILALAFSPDGRLLASAGSDGRVFLHDLVSDTATKLKDGWTPEASAVRFSPDGRIIAAGGDNGFRDLYQASGGGRFRQAQRRDVAIDSSPPPTTSVIALAFSSDGSELFAGYREGIIGIYDVRAGIMKERAQAGTHGLLNAMAVAPDGRAVFTGHSDGAVVLWERPRATYEGWRERVLYRHSAEVRGVGYLSRNRQLATIGFDGRLFVSLPEFTPPLTRRRWSDAEPFRAATWNAEDDRVTLSMTARTVVVDAASETVVATDGPAPSPVDATSKVQPIAVHSQLSAFKNEGGNLVVRNGDRLVEMAGIGDASVLAACFSSNGQVLYTLLADGQLRAWDTATGARRGETPIGETFFPQMTVSRDGALLALARGVPPDFGASGRREQSNRVVLIRTRDFSVVAGNLESLPTGGGVATGALFFTPDSRQLVLESGSISSGGLAHLTLWDVSTLERFDEPVLIPPHAQFLGFPHASQRMVLGSAADGRSTLLDVGLTPELWAGEACHLAADALTRDEWSRYVSRELPYLPACVEGRFNPPTRRR